MGWFEEQIKMRRDSDNEALDDSLKNVSAIIKGKKGFSFGDDRELQRGRSLHLQDEMRRSH